MTTLTPRLAAHSPYTLPEPDDEGLAVAVRRVRDRDAPAVFSALVENLPRAIRRGKALKVWLQALEEHLAGREGADPLDELALVQTEAEVARILEGQGLAHVMGGPLEEVMPLPQGLTWRVAYLRWGASVFDVFVHGRRKIATTTVLDHLVHDVIEVLRQERDRVASVAPLDAHLDACLARPSSTPGMAQWLQPLAAIRDAIRAEGFVTEPLGPGVGVGFVDDPGRLEVSSLDGTVWTFTSTSLASPDALIDEARQYGELRELLTAVTGALSMLHDGADNAVRDAVATWSTTPRWERALAHLDALVGDPEPDDDKRTLVWRLDDDPSLGLSLHAERARRNKRGDGWVTRRTALRELPAALRQHPTDARVYALLEGWRRSPKGITNQAIEALVGHDRVLPPGRSGKPCSVRRVTIALVLDRDGDGLVLGVRMGDERLDLLDFLLLARQQHDAGLLVRWTGTHAEVGAVGPDTVEFVRAWHQRRVELPAEALPQVLGRLASWSRNHPLELAPVLHGHAVEADARPRVDLEGSADGLHVRVRVQPLPEAAAQPPGQGPGELYAVREGEVVHVERDLGAEPEQVRSALSSVPLPDAAVEGAWAAFLPDTQQALAVLDALRTLEARVRTTWTGEIPSLGRRLGPGSMRLRMRSKRDWFRLEADEAGAADLPELDDLLEAVRQGHGYVRLRSGAWGAVEQGLAEALAPVSALAKAGREVSLSPMHGPVVDAIERAGIEIDAPEDWHQLAERLHASRSLDVTEPPMLEAELRPYQQDGFRWLARMAHWAPGAVLADDMGLGKTVQALALLLHRGDEGPALVVAPTSVLFNWQREAARFAPTLRVRTYHGSGREGLLDDLGEHDVVLTTWGTLVADAKDLASTAFATAVLDEAHAVKNPDAQRARAARALDVGFLLALTGTPLENHVGELWSLFAVAVPGVLGSRASFREGFQVPIEAHGDTRRRGALAALIAPFVLRRTKREVARDLPDRIELVHRVLPSREERALYERVRRGALERVEGAEGAQGRMRVLAELQRLRQAACHPELVDPGSPVASSKVAHLLRVVSDLREEGQACLVFSSFTSLLDLVQRDLEAAGVSWVRLDGKTRAEARRQAVDAFQAGQADVFLLSLKAGGTGLNLTQASWVIHLDPWWNPASEDQATDRAHRIGQVRNVSVVRLVMAGSIEEQILSLHAEKRALAEAVLAGGTGSSSLDTSALLALLQAEPEALEFAVDDDGPEEGSEPTPATRGVARVVDVRSPEAAPCFGEAGLPAFVAELERLHATGELRTRAAVLAYTRALDHLRDWLGTDLPDDRSTLEAARDRFVAAGKAGQLQRKSDGPYASAAIGRWIRFVEGNGGA